MTKNDHKHTELVKLINQVQTTVDSLKSEFSELKTELSTRVSANENKLFNVSLKCDINSLQVRKLKHRIDQLECDLSSDQLLFCGIIENEAENCEQIIKNIIVDLQCVEYNTYTISKAYRIGKSDRKASNSNTNRSSPRPILVKFSHNKDRDAIWRNKQKLPGKCFIKAKYPQYIQYKRSVLQAIVDLANSIPTYCKKVKLNSQHQIQIGSSRYGLSDLHLLPNELQKLVGCYTLNNTILFFGMKCPLSNFYPASFCVDDVVFSSTEQFYYYSKALECDNQQAAQLIMATDIPIEIKKIGKSIGSKDSTWNSSPRALEVMKCDLHAKFTQNEYLRSILLSTSDLVIGEANPHDTFWGTGTQADVKNPQSFDKKKWVGKNNLGVLLMDLRSSLK